jgi:RNA polymerase sigma factor (sigma-70 family)
MWKRPSAKPAEMPAAGGDALTEVTRRAQAGDPQATSALLRAVAPSMLRVARQILGPLHPEARDVMQEAAYGLLRALPRFRGECTPLHFACRVAVLAAMNVRRRELTQTAKLHELSELARDRAELTRAPDPEQALRDALCVRTLRDLLGRLPPAQGEALGLHDVVGMTVAEIASMTDTPIETVRSRLKMGRRALQTRVLADQRLSEVVGVRDDHSR